VLLIVSIAILYFVCGLILVFIGPAAKEIYEERSKITRFGGASRFEVSAYSFLLAIKIIFLWPILVPSAARKLRIDDQDEAALNDEHVSTMFVSPYHKRNDEGAAQGSPSSVETSQRPTRDLASVDARAGELRSLRISQTRPTDKAIVVDDNIDPPTAKNADKQPLHAILLLAREGNADAQYELAQRIISGQDSSFDSEAAERWLQRAAEKNHRRAQFLLGALYWNDTFKDKSQKQALNWLRKAADAGMSSAIELLVVVEDKNAKDQIAEWNRRQVLEVKAEVNPEAPPPINIAGTISNTNVRDGTFGYAWSGSPRDKVDLKLLLLGVRRGNKCLSNAIDKLSASNLARADVAGLAPSLAFQIATRRGYLELGSDRGMDGGVDGADLFFDQRRAAFIVGVKEGLDGEDPDECARRYAVK